MKWFSRAVALAIGLIGGLYLGPDHRGPVDTYHLIVHGVEQAVAPSMDSEDAKDLLTFYTAAYAERDSAVVSHASVRMMVEAAYLTATIFPDFGPVNFRDRVIDHLSYGYGETRWRTGQVSYNRPGYTPGVKRFSVDCFWPGINEVHYRDLDNVRDEAMVLQTTGQIPVSLTLAPLPSRQAISQAHLDYVRQVAEGVKPEAMRFSVSAPEDTQDVISSALIYRIIIERDRRRHHMKQEYYSRANARARRYLINSLAAHNIK